MTNFPETNSMQPPSAFKELVFMTTLILTVGLGAWEMAYGADQELRTDAATVEYRGSVGADVPGVIDVSRSDDSSILQMQVED